MAPIPVGHDCAITIIKAEDHSFELNVEELNSILNQEEIRDKTVVVLSVAGSFRKGKSFLLNFMLRYLEAKGSATWLGDNSSPLKGFSWRGGSERDTTGILIWSKIYIIPLPTGEEVAVLLMDTQGAFDSSSTVKECATVFALSTMLSSIQVYNLSQNIQEDDLQHLQLFAEYGRLAIEDSHETPFQKLLFLVRDWSYPYDAEYGPNGGQMILDRRLEITEKQHPQLQQLRRHIKSCFSDVHCFLMPHPGLEVATNPGFDGRISEIRKDFIDQLEVLVPQLLAPENLIPKKIGGRSITAKELVTYFKSYVEVFKGDELPEPKSMLEATAEANNLAALAVAKDLYTSDMEAMCGGSCPYVNSESLEIKHLQTVDNAVQKFLTIRRMGGEELSNQYLDRLRKELEDMFQSYVKFNESKQLSNALRTPATLFCIMVVAFLNSYLLNALTLSLAGFWASVMAGICLLALAAWAYTRYTGDHRYVGEYIDSTVTHILVNFIFPCRKSLLELASSGEPKPSNSDHDLPFEAVTPQVPTKSAFVIQHRKT